MWWKPDLRHGYGEAVYIPTQTRKMCNSVTGDSLYKYSGSTKWRTCWLIVICNWTILSVLEQNCSHPLWARVDWYRSGFARVIKLQYWRVGDWKLVSCWCDQYHSLSFSSRILRGVATCNSWYKFGDVSCHAQEHLFASNTENTFAFGIWVTISSIVLTG